MFNYELYNSGVAYLNEEFSGIYSDFMNKKGDEAQTPNDIAKMFPIEIVSIEDVFELLAEAIQKKGYAHIGCFFEYKPSTVARDTRITRRKVYTDFRQLVCFRGEVYELCNNNCWVERKVFKDTKGKWHLWDGTYDIEVWLDYERVMTTKPPKPTKIYPIES